MKSQVSAQSDHKIISVIINKSEFPRGPGLWKFDTSLLKNEEFLGSMSEFLTIWTHPPELDNHSAIWEWLKFKIKQFVIKFAKGTFTGRNKQ